MVHSDATLGSVPQTRVLVVDDDDNLLFNLGAFLDNHGFAAVCVQSTQEALAAVMAGKVDVVMVDYRLGRESGLELMQEIRRRRPGLPVILMSAFIDEWVMCLVRGQRCAHALRKPFAGNEVLAMLQGALAAK